jgi:hypothetical protein
MVSTVFGSMIRGASASNGGKEMPMMLTWIASAFPVFCCGVNERTTKNKLIPCMEDSPSLGAGSFKFRTIIRRFS